MKKASITFTAAIAFLLSGVAAVALAKAAEEQKGAAEEQDVIGENEIYGGSLMTMDQRRQAHMKYCSATSDAEREGMFAEHRRRIQELAKEKGMEMPDNGMGTAKTWIRHTCPDMEVMHGKPQDAGHHGTPHNMKDVAPETNDSDESQ